MVKLPEARSASLNKKPTEVKNKFTLLITSEIKTPDQVVTLIVPSLAMLVILKKSSAISMILTLIVSASFLREASKLEQLREKAPVFMIHKLNTIQGPKITQLATTHLWAKM